MQAAMTAAAVTTAATSAGATAVASASLEALDTLSFPRNLPRFTNPCNRPLLPLTSPRSGRRAAAADGVPGQVLVWPRGQGAG
jgi:hypothetical protein